MSENQVIPDAAVEAWVRSAHPDSLVGRVFLNKTAPIVPEAAVEAMARELADEELFRADCEGYGWDADTDSSDHFMPTARKKAARYLDAAAPHLQQDVDLMRWKLDALREWSDAMISESNWRQYGIDVKTILDVASMDEAKEIDAL